MSSKSKNLLPHQVKALEEIKGLAAGIHVDGFQVIVDKPIEVQLLEYPEFEMAFIQINKETVYTGNYWDFHPFCHGKVIGGFNVGEKWLGRYHLSLALKAAIEKTGKKCTILEKRTLSHDEYERVFRGGLT